LLRPLRAFVALRRFQLAEGAGLVGLPHANHPGDALVVTFVGPGVSDASEAKASGAGTVDPPERSRVSVGGCVRRWPAHETA
jgi:hypothetical protein